MKYTTHDQWTSLVATRMTYPSGRQVTSGHDALYRRNAVTDTSGSIATWTFFGPDRTAEQVLGNGLIWAPKGTVTNSLINVTDSLQFVNASRCTTGPGRHHLSCAEPIRRSATHLR